MMIPQPTHRGRGSIHSICLRPSWKRFQASFLGMYISQEDRRSTLWQLIGVVLLWMIVILVMTPSGLAAAALTPIEGAEVFDLHCSGCHPHGGNIIRRGQTLKQRALQHNGYDSVEAIADLVTHGKNNMSAFESTLSPAQITEVSAYVLSQAGVGWR